MLDNTDRVLLHRARKGDNTAFAELKTRLEPIIERFIARLVGNGITEPCDIVQDVFIALYLNLEQITPPEKLRPFLFRVARNRCYDELRRRSRYTQVMIEPFEETLSSTAQNPEDASHWSLLREEVERAIDQLPELQRQTMLLYAYEECSYDEIAEIMSVSRGTVKSRMFHARQTLARLLSPETRYALNLAQKDDSQ